MSSLEGVIVALEAAVANNPGDLGVRTHLAGLLLQCGKPQPALDQYLAVLAQDPVNLAALEGAGKAADQANAPDRAAAYRKLHASLAGFTTGTTPVAPPAPQRLNTPALRVIQGGVSEVQINRSGEDIDDDSDDRPPPIKLTDIGGMEQVKRRLEVSFLAPLRNPELRRMYAKKLKGGLLMYGPPGCGKTYIARALAGELNANFVNVGLADVLDMYVGESEKRVYEIFARARRKSPAVLFFDEIDALGQKRSQQRGAAVTRNVVNQLLSEMDGAESDNEGVFILGATNHPWDVDAALRRPGRFDRAVLVLPPDLAAREAILRMHLRGRPVENIDVAALAKLTQLFSGADLAFLCEGATELAMEDAVNTGKARPITMSDFKKAAKDTQASTRSWFDLAKNYAMYANEGGIYDELLAYIKEQKL